MNSQIVDDSVRLLCETDDTPDITVEARTAKFRSWQDETTQFTGYVNGQAVTAYCETHDLAGHQACIWAETQGYDIPLQLWARWDPSVFIIPNANMAALERRIGQMNRKADKLDLPGIELKDLGKVVEKRHLSDEDREWNVKRTVHCTVVRITGDRIKLEGGWIFVGTLEHGEAGNILRAVPDEDIPDQFRTVPAQCDHCQLDRKRKDTYIIRGYGKEYKQVGRTCLKDFLGHRDPNLVAAYMTALAEFGAAVASSDYWMMDTSPSGYEADLYLAIVAASIRLWGWMSRSKATDYNAATADMAISWLADAAKAHLPNHGLPAKDGTVSFTPAQEPIETCQADFNLANDAIAWAASLTAEKTAKNDYLWNVYVVAQEPAYTWRQMGIAASMIPAYQRDLADQLAREETPDSHFLGTIKKRQLWTNLLLVDIKSWDTEWGPNYLHKFQDPDGNWLIWKTGTILLDQGSTYTGKATVKDHNVYNGDKQTVLTRAAFEIQEAAD